MYSVIQSFLLSPSPLFYFVLGIKSMYILSNLKHFRFLGFSSCYEATQLFRRSGKAVLVILKGTYFNIVFTGPNKGNLGRIESNGIKAATTNRYSATSKMNLYLFSCFLCLYIVFFSALGC